MVLELLKVLYQLVRGGFYLSSEISTKLLSPLMKVLDGRGDRLKENGTEQDERDEHGVPLRYKVKKQVASDGVPAVDSACPATQER